MSYDVESERLAADVPMGAGPRILVLIGRIAMLPIRRTSGSSFKDE
jgi:hypothetical protein